jgi:uncharacterized protein (DUF488 family)
MTLPFFTIGHSARSLDDFVALLREARVALLADVRKMPMSRSNPQFNHNTLPDALAISGIRYEHMAALGGLRGKARDVAPDVNGWWTNKSFHNYADYALSTEFHAGLEHLLEECGSVRCALMCSEAVWWRCHRRIVADHLIARGRAVVHIMGEGRLEPARLSDGAVVRADRSIVYPGTAL